MKRIIIAYILVIGGFVCSLWWVLQQGQILEIEKGLTQKLLKQTQEESSALGDLLHNLQHPLAIFILQILTIILTARLLGWLMSKIRQPAVMGEIIAGIVLGPSLIGFFFPEFSTFLFPKASLLNLQFLSQIGLILFMFIVGMELDLSVLKQNSHVAVIVSHASIIFPYFLGVVLAYFLYPSFAPVNVPFSAFALFMGITMSITAFPVLARIIQERNMAKSALGTMAITCAAVDDITAWCLLAVVIAIIKAGAMTGALVTILLAIGYVLFMIYAGKPLLNHVASRYFTRETINKPVVALILLILLFSAYLTEIIGIHALFGAFVAGIIIPPNLEFRQVLAEKIEDISLVLLLPLFFAFSGLRTQISLLNTPHLWGICLLIIVLAVIGKFLGSAIAAKLVGQSWKDSLMIGTLMNTRGLVELVILNIGYDLGVLSPEIFTMMVLMALVTTFMTGPLLEVIESWSKVPAAEAVPSSLSTDKILISFASPQAGRRLLQLVNHLLFNATFEVTALHLTPGTDVSMQESQSFERESFAPILHIAREIGINLKTQYKTSNEISREIINFANQGHFNLMFVGSSRPLFSEYETGGKVKTFFEEVTCPVGTLIDRGFSEPNNLLVLADQPSEALLTLCKKILHNDAMRITFWDNHNLLKHDTTLWEMKTEEHHSKVVRIEKEEINQQFLDNYHLVLMSQKCWVQLRKQKTEWLKYSPSILIVGRKDS
ncbi:cation:proton antiporter [Deltaproteobacteria bacterium TL4]